MQRISRLSVLCLVLSWSCAMAPEGEDLVDLDDQALLAGTAASGVIPTGMPSRLSVGLFEDTGATWMKNSAVRWDMRYRYFTKGWVNNWGWGAYDGSWGLAYLRECEAQGFVPAVQYYQLVGDAGSESNELRTLQNASVMNVYFGDFKLLMQRAKDFGKPVLILLEADAFGFLQQQTNSNPNAAAAIASTGMPELAGLPNTVAGWGQAFLKLRSAVGASNVILGVHISSWASGKDVSYFNVTDPLQPEVDKVHAFLAPLGLAANSTGSQFDVLVGDPLDRDADYYRLVQNQDRTWDASDSASISSKSFNRYAEWLRLWNVKAQKRWVLWQIPLGNSNHKNVANNGGGREGYKDNRPEYFFQNGTAHLQKFADVGVISLLFGAGAGGQSSYETDTYTDGQLFMKSRAGAFLNAGGLALSGGSTPTPTPTPTPNPNSDAAQFNFESGAQAWVTSGGILTAVASSTDQAYAGSRSLKLTFAAGGAGSQRAVVRTPATPAAARVTFHLYVPAGAPIASVQPYVLQGAAGGWRWTGAWTAGSSLLRGQWNAMTLQVPSNASVPLSELGVEISTSGSWNGAAYVDSVTW
jgi:hypothetical protein